MDPSRPEALRDGIDAIKTELRCLLRLPEWSNLRGDDVIALVEALDADSRVLVNDLFVRLRELEDERARL